MPGEGLSQALYAVIDPLEKRVLRHFQGTGLHWGLRRILQHLWLKDGLSQAELAVAVRFSEASISNMLKHLLKGGWVERRRDAYDYRVSRIYVAEKGARLRDDVEATLADADSLIRAELPAADAEALALLLGEVQRILDASSDAVDEEGPTGIYDRPGPPGGA